MPGARAEQGLTLVEMLVVLAIIGIAAGATVLGLGAATRGVSTEAEAQQLAARIRLAADDAMVTDRPVTFRWDEAGYAFAGAGVDQAEFTPHTLPKGVRLEMGRPAGSLSLGVDGSGSPVSARLVSSSEVWNVVYDGLTVSAAAAPRR